MKDDGDKTYWGQTIDDDVEDNPKQLLGKDNTLELGGRDGEETEARKGATSILEDPNMEGLNPGQLMLESILIPPLLMSLKISIRPPGTARYQGRIIRRSLPILLRLTAMVAMPRPTNGGPRWQPGKMQAHSWAHKAMCGTHNLTWALLCLAQYCH